MGGLGTTYDINLRLIGKRVVDFLLVLIELFSLGVTVESLRAKRDKKGSAENAGVENAGVENTGAITYGKPSNRK